MVAFGAQVDTLVVAEGIDDPDELAALRVLDVRIAQGFHFARPVPVGALSSWETATHNVTRGTSVE